MSRGFILLIGLSAVIGIVSIIQISSLNSSIDDLTMHKMATIESVDESKFEGITLILFIIAFVFSYLQSCKEN